MAKQRLKFDPVTKKLQKGGMLSPSNYDKAKKTNGNILTNVGKGLFDIVNETMSSAEKGVNVASQFVARELVKRTHNLTDNDLPEVRYEDHASTIQRMNPNREVGLGEGLALNAVGDPLTFLSLGKLTQGYNALKAARTPKMFKQTTINLTHPKDVAKANSVWNTTKKAETWGGLAGLGVDALDNGVVNKNQRGGVLNPTTWFTKDYSDSGNFNSAYGDAKRDGKSSFMFKGKRYSTDYAGTPRQEAGKYGKGLSAEDLQNPSYVKLNPVGHKNTLPGHIAATSGNMTKEITNIEGYGQGELNTNLSVDYGLGGNMDYGNIGSNYRNADSSKGEEGMFIYNKSANSGIDNKSKSLRNKKDWCLLTNNCADVVSDAYGLQRDSFVPTMPGAVFNRLKDKYGGAAVKANGRMDEDYQDAYEQDLQESQNGGKNILSKADHWLGITSSPEYKNSPFKNRVAKDLQYSLIQNGAWGLNNDATWGKESKKALDSYKRKMATSAVGVSNLNPVLNIGSKIGPPSPISNFTKTITKIKYKK